MIYLKLKRCAKLLTYGTAKTGYGRVVMKYLILFLIVLSVCFASTAMAGEVVVNGFRIGPTAVGNFAITCWPPSAGSYCPATITFPGRVASAASRIIWLPQGSGSTADCPGTSADPQASSGTLCIYEQTQGNVGSRFVCGAGSISCPGTTTFGTVLWVSNAAAGYVTSQGSWAFTP